MTTSPHHRPHLHRGIAVRVRGNGEPVLLLHGIGGSAASCTGVAERLATAGFRAIAWDAPGYGDSTDPASPPGLEGYLDAVSGLLEDLGAAPAHLVGTSWGGVIATCVAAHRPGLVRTLTLLDSTRGSAVAQERADAMRARPVELEAVGAEEFARRRAARLTAPDAEPSVVADVERQMARVRVPGYTGAAEFMADTNTEPLLAGITTPTLVLVGEHDRVTGVPESELLASRIADARFAVIPGAGHAAVSERPGAVARAITAFVATTRVRDRAGARR